MRELAAAAKRGVGYCHSAIVASIFVFFVYQPSPWPYWIEDAKRHFCLQSVPASPPGLTTRPDQSDDARPAFGTTAKGGGLTAATTSNSNNINSIDSNNNKNDNDNNSKASPSSDSSAQTKRFICTDQGLVLPIILAGVYKGGSTTFWLDLQPALWNVSPAGSAIAHCTRDPSQLCKEPNFFGRGGDNYSFDLLWGRCTDAQPGVVMDFSTGSLYAPWAPARVKMVYKQKYQEVIFAWGFREPVNRTISQYYYIARDRPKETWVNVSFPDQAQKILRSWWERFGGSCEKQTCLGTRGNNEGLFWIQSSLYYRHLRMWLDEGFRASQMVIYPGNLYMKHRDNLKTNPVLEALRARIGHSTFNVTHPWQQGSAANEGSRKHVFPENATLVDAAKSRLEKEIFAAENKKLFQLLAEEVGNGMTLVGYTGKANDVEAVEKWMTSDWNY